MFTKKTNEKLTEAKQSYNKPILHPLILFFVSDPTDLSCNQQGPSAAASYGTALGCVRLTASRQAAGHGGHASCRTSCKGCRPEQSGCPTELGTSQSHPPFQRYAGTQNLCGPRQKSFGYARLGSRANKPIWVKQHRSALCAAPQRYDMRSGATVVPASLVARGARGRQWLRMAAEDCRRPSRVSAETHVASQHNASPNYNDIPHPPFPNMEYPSTWLEILLMWEENICEISPPCGGNRLRGVAGGAQVGWKLRITSAPLIFSLAGRGRPGRSRPRSGPRDSQEARRHSCTHFGVSVTKLVIAVALCSHTGFPNFASANHTN